MSRIAWSIRRVTCRAVVIIIIIIIIIMIVIIIIIIIIIAVRSTRRVTYRAIDSSAALVGPALDLPAGARQAVSYDANAGIPSTKGVLS